MISPEVVKRLRDTHEWKAVEDYLRAAVASLDTIADIEGDDRLVAVEVLARKRAASTLVKILQPFIEFHDRPSVEQLAKERAQDAGLDIPRY